MRINIAMHGKIAAAVLISADTEWQAVLELYPDQAVAASPVGAWFVADIATSAGVQPVLYFHGGWGKIAAAASTQYVIDRWSPPLLINLGTCGGFEGEIERGKILLVDRTVVYDIVEQMGDPDQAIAAYGTHLDLSWLAPCYPHEVTRTLLVSADRDLLAGDVAALRDRYGAVAGDWESGAIAWVAQRNGVRCLVLRGVTDLVGSNGGEAYGNFALFVNGTREIMARLVGALPGWLACAYAGILRDAKEE